MESEQSLNRGIARMRGASILATDGRIGRVQDLYFDDRRWATRYIVVDTDGWLSGRQVLISPMAIQSVDWEDSGIRLNLTREQIENSPGIGHDEPVSRQYERRHYAYYGWPLYSAGNGVWDKSNYPILEEGQPAGTTAEGDQEEHVDPHLRSAADVVGYRIHGTDGDFGSITDLLINNHSWKIRWLAVDTTPWWPGGNVLIMTGSVRKIAWQGRSIDVDLTTKQIADSPAWEEGKSMTMEEERSLIDRWRNLRHAA